MANTVDIEVRLEGAEEAKRGLKGIGSTAGDMAGHFEKFNSHLGEGLGQVVGNVEELGGSFGELKDTIGGVAKTGGASIMSMLPALGAVAAAGFAIYETFLNISGATQEMENRTEAMSAAAADLQSKLEALAEKGVSPTGEALKKFTIQTLESQFAKELLETEYQKLLPTMQKYKDALKAEEDRKKDLNRGGAAHLNALETEKKSLALIIKLRQKLHTEIGTFRTTQLEVMKGVADAAKEERKLEDQSAESTLARVGELKTKVEALEAESLALSGLTDQYKEEETARLKREAELETAFVDRNKKNAKVLLDFETTLKAREKSIDREEVLRLREEKTIEDSRKKRADEAKKSEDVETARRLAKKKLADAQRIMLERQSQNELFSLRALQIQQMKQAGATELQILESQHQLEQDRARENHALLLAADIRFEMAKTELLKSEEAKRQAERDKRQSEILKQIDERTQREQAYIDQAGEIADAFGGAFAEASFGALAMGESFKESIAQIIFGLGKQAAVESLISTAKMFSSLAMGDLVGAANNLKAATGFAAGAVAAGVAGSALAGGGGGGGGGGSASPSGAPQIAPTPERESAQETSTVFNINFGGAVIYDTKQAAERAMVDRLVGVMNQRNRGARRLNLGRS